MSRGLNYFWGIFALMPPPPKKLSPLPNYWDDLFPPCPLPNYSDTTHLLTTLFYARFLRIFTFFLGGAQRIGTFFFAPPPCPVIRTLPDSWTRLNYLGGCYPPIAYFCVWSVSGLHCSGRKGPCCRGVLMPLLTQFGINAGPARGLTFEADCSVGTAA